MHIKTNTLGIIVAIMALVPNMASANWQQELEGKFDIVETFDELQDWTPGSRFYSAAGCATCASNQDLPKKNDGSDSMWSLWNSKGMSLQYEPGAGEFVMGDVITGNSSGATATVKQVWNVSGKRYVQITSNQGVKGTSNLIAGEGISSGSKTGSNIQWPLFIANHGAANTWRGVGKSLVMDLGDNNGSSANPAMEGLGAQRMGTYFGDGISGKSGYKKPYIFFMLKLNKEFLRPCHNPTTSGCVEGGYDTASVIKMFEVSSGFMSVSKWGTNADLAKVDPQASNYYRLQEYGLNFGVFNFYGGGATYPHATFFSENPAKAALSGSTGLYTYVGVTAKRMRVGTNLDVNAYMDTEEWFGVEVAYDIGTPNNADGSIDFWIYDKNGVERGHYALTGQNNLVEFDHYYNKLVIGGNRLSANMGVGGLDARWWVDDIVIDDARIGPKYFSTLALSGSQDVVAPAAPTGLRIL